MKSILLLSALLFSFSAFAFQEGVYNCGVDTDSGRIENSYNIKSLDVGGTVLPYLAITTTKFRNPNDSTSQDKTNEVKGIATQFTNSEGTEILMLGSLTLELKTGRPNCGQ